MRQVKFSLKALVLNFSQLISVGKCPHFTVKIFLINFLHLNVCSTCSNADVVIPLATETMTWTPLMMVWRISSITDRTRCGLTAMITNWECWTTILLLKVVLHPQSLKKDCFIYIIYILQSSRKNYYVTVFYTIFYKYISSFKVKYYIYIH